MLGMFKVRRPEWLQQLAPHLCCLGLCAPLQTLQPQMMPTRLDGFGHSPATTAWLAFLLPSHAGAFPQGLGGLGAPVFSTSPCSPSACKGLQRSGWSAGFGIRLPGHESQLCRFRLGEA